MKILCTQSGVYRGVIALLVVAVATACSGQREVATTAATPSATDAPIPDTA